MDLLGSRGPEPGTVAHYVKADRIGGVVVLEQDDVAKIYESVLAYAEYLDFTVTPALTIEDAAGPIMAYLRD